MSNGHNRPQQHRGGGNRHPGAQVPSRNWTAEFQPAWIEKGINKQGVEFADAFGKALKEMGLTTSQIRNVFGELKRIQMKGFAGQKNAFYLLKPKLAYSVARMDRKELTVLRDVFNKAYDTVDADGQDGEKHFQNLVSFMEATLAYHKAYGGK